MIQLHLQRGGKVDQVIQFVKDALSQTIQDKYDVDAAKTTELDRLDTIISSLKNDLRDLNDERSTTILRINSLIQLISTLDTRITNLQNELAALIQREEFIETARNNDVTTFNARQARDTKAISSLNEIIDVLNKLLEDSGSD